MLLCSSHYLSCRLLHGTWSQDFSSHTPRSPVLVYVLEQRGSTTTRARRLLLLPVEPVYPLILKSSISSQHQHNILTTSTGLIDSSSVLRNTLSCSGRDLNPRPLRYRLSRLPIRPIFSVLVFRVVVVVVFITYSWLVLRPTPLVVCWARNEGR